MNPETEVTSGDQLLADDPPVCVDREQNQLPSFQPVVDPSSMPEIKCGGMCVYGVYV